MSQLMVSRERDAYGLVVVLTGTTAQPRRFRAPEHIDAAWRWAVAQGASVDCFAFMLLIPLVGEEPVPVPMGGEPVAT